MYYSLEEICVSVKNWMCNQREEGLSSGCLVKKGGFLRVCIQLKVFINENVHINISP